MTTTKKSQTKTPAKKPKTTKNATKTIKTVATSKKFYHYVLAILFFVVAVVATILLKPKNNIVTEAYSVIHETKFGGVYIKSTIDDFNALGFKYGDSVNVEFSNGYKLEDIPYYNGYYVDIDEPLLIAYPGYDYIKAAVNYGADLWDTAKLTEKDTAIISLNKREKYLKIQKASDLKYSDTQGGTPDTTFANFRVVKAGDIKTGNLFRSASPVDNSHKRAAVVDRLIKDAGVKYIVNLSDSDGDLVTHINKSDFDSPYFLSLYNAKKVVALDMTAQFKSKDFEQKLVKGLTAMANNPGPYLVHCVEGKDRTGYVMMVIEALAGASYKEMVNDYMKTYEEYYNITKETDKSRYETIKEKNIDLMLYYVTGNSNTTDKENLAGITDYDERVKSYLISIGMSETSINQLISNLTK